MSYFLCAGCGKKEPGNTIIGPLPVGWRYVEHRDSAISAHYCSSDCEHGPLAARLAEVEVERDNALALAEQLEWLLKEARGGAE